MLVMFNVFYLYVQGSDGESSTLEADSLIDDSSI